MVSVCGVRMYLDSIVVRNESWTYITRKLPAGPDQQTLQLFSRAMRRHPWCNCAYSYSGGPQRMVHFQQCGVSGQGPVFVGANLPESRKVLQSVTHPQ